jgi:Alpha/beta hydrolase domain
MRGQGTLVDLAGAYPALSGLPYRGTIGPAQLVDNTVMPPVVRGEYTVLVPRVDADGNAIGGLRGPVVEVPKATYTGWNPRSEGFAPGALCYNTGAVLPYPTPEAYVAAVRASAERLAAERLLLAEDVAAITQAASADSLARLRR